MAGRPRILVLAGDSQSTGDLLQGGPEAFDLVAASGWPASFPSNLHAVLLDLSDPAGREKANRLFQAGSVLDCLTDGLAVVDLQLRILWANRTFHDWSGGTAQGRYFYEALGSTAVLPASDGCPFHTSLRGEAVTKRLVGRDNRVLELHITPLQRQEAKGKRQETTEDHTALASQREGRLLALCRDVTADLHHQQQLEALHKAGRELSALDPAQLAEMSPEERIELLKHNVRRCTRDLLHYEIVELRLLDRRTNRLEPLLVEGMDAEAADRRLLALPEHNGITGRVGATGKSYLCHDTQCDDLYLSGAQGMRSSLTVPLSYQDEIIGTFNVESPQVHAFDVQDVQFLEIFCREIASALHTLELLTAEKREASTHAVDAVRSEVALPVDDILGAAAALLERYIGLEADMSDKLKVILARARTIKERIEKVGQDLAPPPPEEIPPPPFKGLCVLVVDNDERVRRVAHDILGRWGCTVETARDGHESLTLAKLTSYNAILADIRLPDMSGYDAYRQLRAAQPRAQVILMTEYGYDPSHSLVKARQDGLKHALFKPFRIDQLRDALAECARDDRKVAPAADIS